MNADLTNENASLQSELQTLRTDSSKSILELQKTETRLRSRVQRLAEESEKQLKEITDLKDKEIFKLEAKIKSLSTNLFLQRQENDQEKQEVPQFQEPNESLLERESFRGGE